MFAHSQALPLPPQWYSSLKEMVTLQTATVKAEPRVKAVCVCSGPRVRVKTLQ